MEAKKVSIRRVEPSKRDQEKEAREQAETRTARLRRSGVKLTKRKLIEMGLGQKAADAFLEKERARRKSERRGMNPGQPKRKYR